MRLKYDLDDQLPSFSALIMLVWLSEITYNVLSMMLSLYSTHTLTDTLEPVLYPATHSDKCFLWLCVDSSSFL